MPIKFAFLNIFYVCEKNPACDNYFYKKIKKNIVYKIRERTLFYRPSCHRTHRAFNQHLHKYILPPNPEIGTFLLKNFMLK